MITGNIFFVNTVDGEELIMEYLKMDRGFILFRDSNSNVRAFRPSSLLTVTDTGQSAKDLKPLKLKNKVEEEDLPTEIITVSESTPLSSQKGH